MWSSGIIVILAPFLLAVAVLLVPRRAAWLRGHLALLSALLVLGFGIYLWRIVPTGRVMTAAAAWMPDLGINVDLRFDRLGAFFVVLVGGIGLCIFQYARIYLAPSSPRDFWALMLAFEGAMVGIVLCDNLLVLYVFWELTTVTSALLIARSDQPAGRSGAFGAFITTAAGGLCLLTGVVLLGQATGTYNLSVLEARGAEIVGNPAHQVALLLILLGALTKSAQVPFHFWLPGAMAAPAPVSAYLHSATMVKAGIFLIARMFPVFSESPLWSPVLASVGLTSFVVGGWNALWNDDVKRLLAYSTIAYLGLLVTQYAYAGPAGPRGELVNITNHALYKSALFLLVGWVEKATGTRDLRTLARERWPPRELAGTLLFGLGAMALAGSPLFLGFLSKEYFLSSLMHASEAAVSPALAVGVIASALAVAYALKIFTAMLFGSEVPPESRIDGHGKPSRWLLIIPALLLLPQVLAGLAPGFFLLPLLESGSDPVVWPAIWRHFDGLLVASLLSFLFGGVLFLFWRRIWRVAHLPVADWSLAWLTGSVLAVCRTVGRVSQLGGHPRYLIWMILALLPVALVPWLVSDVDVRRLTLGTAPLHGIVAAIVTVVPSVLLVALPGRLTKVVMLGVVGYGVAFFYVLFRAPDLVLTQILVETVSLVLVVLVWRRMPASLSDPRGAATKAAHASLALVFGSAMALLAWLAGTGDAVERSGHIQRALAWPLAHGRNVVNVILVDFRGIDTLGEIVVLTIAAIGVMSLARSSWRDRDDMRSFFLLKGAKLLLPITGVFSLYLLVRGHNQPGGGFSAGLVTGLAVVIQWFGFGAQKTRAWVRRYMRPVLWVGLGIAAFATLLPMLFGDAPLTHYHGQWQSRVPGVFSTALLFDVGVYGIVVGAVVTYLEAMTRESGL